MIPGPGVLLMGAQQHTGPIPAWNSQQWADGQPLQASGASSSNLILNSLPFVFAVMV